MRSYSEDPEVATEWRLTFRVHNPQILYFVDIEEINYAKVCRGERTEDCMCSTNTSQWT